MKKILEKEKFQPSLFSIFYHPFYFVRKEIANFLKKNSNICKGNMLDFGGGSKPYKEFFSKTKNYFAIEVLSNKPNLNSDVYYNGLNLPFKNNFFNSILCSEVFEHVENLDFVLSELYRVLKPGGKIIITSPFICMEHEMPNDYRRFTINGLVNFLKQKKFKIIQSQKLLNNFHVFAQTLNFYMCQLFLKKKKNYRIFIYFFLVGPINLLSLILNLFFPKIEEMYFGSGIIAQK